jgi:hypothetical protein
LNVAAQLVVGKSKFTPSDGATDTAILCDGEIVAECFGRSSPSHFWDSRALAERLVARDAAYQKLVDALSELGFYDPNGKWVPESDYSTTSAAAARVAYLNGGKDAAARAALKHLSETAYKSPLADICGFIDRTLRSLGEEVP